MIQLQTRGHLEPREAGRGREGCFPRNFEWSFGPDDTLISDFNQEQPQRGESHLADTTCFFSVAHWGSSKRRPFGSVYEMLTKDANLTSTKVDTGSDSAGRETRPDPFPSSVLGFRCIGLMSLTGEQKAGSPPLLWGSARLLHPPLRPSGTSLCTTGTLGRRSWLQVVGTMRHPRPHGRETVPRGRKRQKREREAFPRRLESRRSLGYPS